ncbi:hypothetical protein C823_005680 [Eubacterium plexicaudatum ASF492]|uniref:Uncharacterized protein n=1 Tax=Eubacterium plexicaudatum ASF492 TaxID=1235802 RepID=N2B8F0_9FIRM|nr:hypothetical protein C823_005680 [Eubacterium plexicaudatum ASF492]
MDRKYFIHVQQDEAYRQYQDGVMFQEDIEKVYEEIDCKFKMPDLLGKTVCVSERQFQEVHKILHEILSDARTGNVPIYVYEDYYYGAESYGIEHPWIELSAKTIQDFTDSELKFVLAREIYKIADDVTRQRTMMEERFKAMRKIMPDKIEEVSRLSFYHWYRLANFSADNYGYLMCGSVKTAVNAILKMVLNSVMLAEQVDIKEFIGQASEINRLDDVVSNYTKADESMPYAPHRVQNLLAYAVSGRGMEIKERMEGR